jgi:(S)-ureidoglycine aminohydrolase
MPFQERPKKGLARFLVDDHLQGEQLSIHISQVGPGERSHPPHQHPGIEAFYMFEGQGTLEIEDERIILNAGESMVFDSTRMHGLVNTGDVPMRYMVIIRP